MSTAASLPRSPISYAPQYGGLCAEGVPNGEVTVNIEPESWQIVDGKLYLSAAASFQDRRLNLAKAEGKWPSVHVKLTSDKWNQPGAARSGD